jgi:hypothetical protein
MASAIGTYVVAIDGPAAPYRDSLKAFEKLNADPGFKKGIDRIFSAKLAELEEEDSGDDPGSDEAQGKAKPNTKPKAKPVKAKPVSHLLSLKPKAVQGLPAGSQTSALVFELKATEALLEETKPNLPRKRGLPKFEVERLSLLVSVIPDGNRTWLIVTADEKSLVEHAKGVISTSTKPRLSTRAEVAPLRGTTAYRAGFSTLLELKSYLSLALAASGKAGKETDTVFSTLPHHGVTPMFYKYTVGGDPERPIIEGQVTVPRAVFDDVAASIPTLMMSF